MKCSPAVGAASLPDEHPAKQAALEFFEFCLTQGLTVEEQGAILAWITPYMQRHLGLAKPN